MLLRTAGFTIIELLVSLAIVLLVAGVAVTLFVPSFDTELRVERIQTDLNSTQVLFALRALDPAYTLLPQSASRMPDIDENLLVDLYTDSADLLEPLVDIEPFNLSELEQTEKRLEEIIEKHVDAQVILLGLGWIMRDSIDESIELSEKWAQIDKTTNKLVSLLEDTNEAIKTTEGDFGLSQVGSIASILALGLAVFLVYREDKKLGKKVSRMSEVIMTLGDRLKNLEEQSEAPGTGSRKMAAKPASAAAQSPSEKQADMELDEDPEPPPE